MKAIKQNDQALSDVGKEQIGVIYCGDNIDVMRDMEDESVDLIYADPPFYSGRMYDQIWSIEQDPVVGGMQHYIGWMKDRMQECYRLLRPNGSIYLHCDWRSHYLKEMMDEIFGYKSFRNEIVWCYGGASTPTMRQFARKHDTILYYSKGEEWTFNANDVGDRGFPADWWEIPAIGPNSKERIGYPTQKPEALLDRIVRASSDVGDVVLDPFCGCGTAVAVAQKTGRKWIGIDINREACCVISTRVNCPVNLVLDGEGDE